MNFSYNINDNSCVPAVASGRSTFGRLQGKKAERVLKKTFFLMPEIPVNVKAVTA